MTMALASTSLLPRITDVRFTAAAGRNDKLQAFVTVTFEDCFVISGIKIVQLPRGPLVAMPSRRKPDGSFQDVAHPIHAGARSAFEAAVLTAYAEWQRQLETSR